MFVLAATSRHPKPAIHTPMPFDSRNRIVEAWGRGHPVRRSGATTSVRTTDAPTDTVVDAAVANASANSPQPRHNPVSATTK